MYADEKLEELRRLCAEYENGYASDAASDEFKQEIVGLVLSLDHWLSNGGELPTDWKE